MDITRAALLKMFGLPETAADADVLAAANMLGQTLAQMGAITSCSAELKAIKAQIETFSATGTGHKDGIEALAKRLQKAEDTIQTFTVDRAAQERAAIIDGAKREGKVLPFSAEALLTTPIETLREVAKNTPATVPMEQRTAVVETFNAGTRAGMGDPGTASAVAAKFGRTVADLTKAEKEFPVSSKQ